MTAHLHEIYRPTVLAVDDDPESLRLIAELLRDNYHVRVATGGEQALRAAELEPRPDLILLDVVMPGMDGYDLCRRFRAQAHTRDTPILFLTVRSNVVDEEKGFAAGGVDYLTKPISPPILLARVRTHIMLKGGADFLKDQNAFLQEEIHRRIVQMSTIQDVAIVALASLAETRDNDTGNHVRRTQYYVEILANELRSHVRFAPLLTEDNIELLYKSAVIHDIGKVGIPDHILLKPGKLTPDEFEIMKTHTVLGRNAILAAERLLDAPNDFLRFGREIALSHHERWNGKGYPEGLAGEAIPVSARLMAVADVYDALISKRPYKEPYTHQEAVAIIAEERGQQFDPDVTDAFLSCVEDFRQIALQYADREENIGIVVRRAANKDAPRPQPQ
jgi:putative two-component system response regulator